MPYAIKKNDHKRCHILQVQFVVYNNKNRNFAKNQVNLMNRRQYISKKEDDDLKQKILMGGRKCTVKNVGQK